jgi:hypothetical protein
VGFGTVEGVRWEGRFILTPMPEAYELRVTQLCISISCARAYSIIYIEIEYAPSSEPDAGERRVPYIIRCMMEPVFKPIKEGIAGYVRGVRKAIAKAYNEY